MFQDDLKDFLLKTFTDARLVSGGKEVVMKCRYCMDSPDPKSRHFYISVGDETKPNLFECKLCHESGMLNSVMLRSFGIFDPSMTLALNDFNKKIMLMPQNRVYANTGIHMIKNTFISQTELSAAKLKYINNRLGLNLTYDDLLKNKIVLNLYDLMNLNYIKDLTRNVKIVNELSESFIGFLSYDNSFMNMRNLRQGKVYESIDKRYVNYNLFNKADNSKRYYVLPNEINLNNPTPIKVHISEGPFDILSVYYNLNKANSYHSIYASIGGSSYLNVIKFFIQGLGLMNIELHIYPDGDISDWNMNNLAAYLKPFNSNIFIHRNIFANQKDFGVSPDKIKEQVVQINRRILLQ